MIWGRSQAATDPFSFNYSPPSAFEFFAPPGFYTLQVSTTNTDGSTATASRVIDYDTGGEDDDDSVLAGNGPGGIGGGSTPPPQASVTLDTINGVAVTGNDEFAYDQVGSDLVLAGSTANSGGTVTEQIIYNGTTLPDTVQSTDVDEFGNFTFDVPASTIAGDENSPTLLPGSYTIAVGTYNQDGTLSQNFYQENLTVDAPSGGGGGGGGDGTPPSISLNAIPTINDAILQTGVTVSGSTDAFDGASVTGLFTGADGTQFAVDLGTATNGQFSQFVPGNLLQFAVAQGALPDGQYGFVASVSDQDGTGTSNTDPVLVATVPPAFGNIGLNIPANVTGTGAVNHAAIDIDQTGQLLPGDEVDFQLQTNSPVTVQGSPTLILDNGQATANFIGLDATGAPNFSFVAAPGQFLDDLFVTGLDTTNGSVTDINGNPLAVFSPDGASYTQANPLPLTGDTGIGVSGVQGPPLEVSFTQGIEANSSGKLTFKGTVSDPGATVVLDDDNGFVAEAKVRANGTWKATANFGNGVQVTDLHATAYDQFGQTADANDPFGAFPDPNRPNFVVNAETSGDPSVYVYTPGSGNETIDHFNLGANGLSIPKSEISGGASALTAALVSVISHPNATAVIPLNDGSITLAGLTAGDVAGYALNETLSGGKVVTTDSNNKHNFFIA